ncbi:hypothetical protein V6Z11_D08G117900 [Gossypium hirsutum]
MLLVLRLNFIDFLLFSLEPNHYVSVDYLFYAWALVHCRCGFIYHNLEKEILKNIFVEVKNKFETALGIFRKEKITIDPDDPAAVSQYANVMKTVREKKKKLKLMQELSDCLTFCLSLNEIFFDFSPLKERKCLA